MINRDVEVDVQRDIQGWDAIIDHRTGTDGDQRTAEWLADMIRAAGAEPHLDAFPFTRRILHECAISIGDRRLEGVPAFDGGYTTEEGILARLTPLMEDSKKNYKGDCIAVTSFSPAGEHPPTLLHSARTKPYQAIVAYSARAEMIPGLALVNAPRYHEPYGPPVLQVATEHQDWLEDAAGEQALAHLVAHVTQEETTACNVQTRITGRDPSLAPLVIMTPRSAWWTCTAERAGGIALWLACVRHFVDAGSDRDVIFTANTGHELGHVGLDHYLAQQPTLLQDAHAWIHLGANFAAVDSKLWYQASPALMALGLDALATEGCVPEKITPEGNQPTGEAGNIYDGGGRYLSLLGDNRWFHHPDDRWPDTVDIERMARLNRAMIHVATVLARDGEVQ